MRQIQWKPFFKQESLALSGIDMHVVSYAAEHEWASQFQCIEEMPSANKRVSTVRPEVTERLQTKEASTPFGCLSLYIKHHQTIE